MLNQRVHRRASVAVVMGRFWEWRDAEGRDKPESDADTEPHADRDGDGSGLWHNVPDDSRVWRIGGVERVMPQSQINTLYGNGTGDLGLTIMRLRIAPTTWNTANMTADTTQWTAELTNGKAAQAMGAIVFATPWSPPRA